MLVKYLMTKGFGVRADLTAGQIGQANASKLVKRFGGYWRKIDGCTATADLEQHQSSIAFWRATSIWEAISVRQEMRR